MTSTYAGGRMVFVHAHPDDESITTGGAIAYYAARGVDVTVVTCTLGEEGEVIGERYAGLVADQADQLGGYRIAELTAALGLLGSRPPRFLGGAGRWRDSGMAGTPSAANPRAFINANLDDAAGALADILDEIRPHVVVGYDPAGTYGHPDHKQVHTVTSAAVARSAQVAKYYWTVVGASTLRTGIAELADLPVGWRYPADGELVSLPDEAVTCELDITEVFAAKRAAMAAHATQVVVDPRSDTFALSNNIAQPLLAVEQYQLISGEAGAVDARGRETDLFAGIELGAAELTPTVSA